MSIFSSKLLCHSRQPHDQYSHQKLMKEDDDENEELHQYRPALSLIPWTWWCLLNAGLLLLAFLAIRKVATPPPTSLHDLTLTDDNKSFPSGQLTWSQKFTPLPCGKSPTEALARGCHFDIIATAWLPPKCIDYELVSEFIASYQWQYFPSANGTDPYLDDPDTLGSQTGLIWTTHRWHYAHCLFMWKKLNRALVRGRMTDGETIKLGHTEHCSTTILKMKDPDVIGSIVEVIYPPC
ncbi:uncharacterized protein ATNIH1004_005756 [Aspergillus tanneri]|uniref:Uncharacterized protein n=1 Tax=Aspergillus tanneri TaxID=1220188 RepID=A0A5M9MQ42_9EURO|nr:uncharacterized protein ATNIH1004_005756 [Aspergillus tanneri]KAA8647073.1 hypothetical protein ATNIH1004_005756 [Aspergillus tanneri]